MSFLVTFADGHSTLFTARADAELAASYWPHEQPTIRDLDQEARDRKEMIGLLVAYALNGNNDGGCIECGKWESEHMDDCILATLLKRLGRLP